jgi:MFS family permease
MSTVSDDLVVDIPRSRIAVASMVGTTVEFYDFYVYATAAVSVFPQLLFPRSSPTTALLAPLATFGLAFVARPVGSMLFGHFGDRVGRKETLVASLLLSYGTAARPPKGTGLGYGYVDFLQLQLIAVLFFAATIPLAGLLIDRFGRRRTSAGARTPLRGCEFGVPAVAAAGGGGAVQRDNGFPAGGVPHPDAAAVDEQPAARKTDRLGK